MTKIKRETKSDFNMLKCAACIENRRKKALVNEFYVEILTVTRIIIQVL